MHRLFLDANVLFSAAYSEHSKLRRLWELKDVQLLSSRYALEEARGNLTKADQLERLRKLETQLELHDASERELPAGVRLPDKDVPILLAAMEAQATHLLTGDVRHFGPFLGKKVSGVRVMQPGDSWREKVAGG